VSSAFNHSGKEGTGAEAVLIQPSFSGETVGPTEAGPARASPIVGVQRHFEAEPQLVEARLGPALRLLSGLICRSAYLRAGPSRGSVRAHGLIPPAIFGAPSRAAGTSDVAVTP